MVKFFLNGEQITELRFPITEVGTFSDITMMLENEFSDFMELIPVIGDNDVQIIEFPRRLKPREQAKTVWRFTPSQERLQQGKKVSLDTECGFRQILG